MATVRNILQHKGGNVVTCTPQETVLRAARVMNEHGIGALVVVEGGKVTGIFTERDIMRRVVAAGLDPAATAVQDVMTQPVISCAPDTPIDECRAIVTARRVRHLPVVEEGMLRGIVTSGDVLAQQLREQQEALDYLNSWAYGGR
jgi:CBS domain-containing protein